MREEQMLKKFLDHPCFNHVITFLIIANAIILGMETYPKLQATHGHVLRLMDHTILWIFVGELVLRLVAYRAAFIRDPWAMFDLFVVGIAFMPTQEVFSVLRVVRVLRVLRLVSMFPRLRRVVEGLVKAIPSISSIGAILAINMYVFAVMATKLYGSPYPDWFGSLHASFFSLFQIMTLEGWPDIVRTVMQTHPYAWIFFVFYILIATFSVLNLFIAVIVDAMQKQHEVEEHDTLKQIEGELAKINEKIDQLKMRNT